MIRTFAHKGLERFYDTGSRAGIQSSHAAKLRLLLGHLDAAVNETDMAFPGSGLHRLKGSLAGHFAVRVSGAWRVTFRMRDGDAIDLNYVQYR